MKYIIKVQLLPVGPETETVGDDLAADGDEGVPVRARRGAEQRRQLRVLGPELLAAPRHQRRRVVHQLSPAPRPGDCPAPCHAPSLGQQPGVCS